MEAAKLRRSITIQSPPVGKDSEGLPNTVWTDVLTTRASVEPLQGREYFQAAAVSTKNQVRMKIRYRPGVLTTMRVLYGVRIFNIRSIIDPEERHVELQLMCEEVVAGA